MQPNWGLTEKKTIKMKPNWTQPQSGQRKGKMCQKVYNSYPKQGQGHLETQLYLRSIQQKRKHRATILVRRTRTKQNPFPKYNHTGDKAFSL